VRVSNSYPAPPPPPTIIPVRRSRAGAEGKEIG
jgi:hypothetical protein